MLFKILIAEDVSGIQSMLHRYFENLQAIFNRTYIDIQFQIFYVDDGEKARDCYAKHRCDFVIMDIELLNNKYGDAAILAILDINPIQTIYVHSAKPRAEIESGLRLLNVKEINTETVKFFKQKTCSEEELGIAILQTINNMNLIVQLDESILGKRKAKIVYQQPISLPNVVNVEKESKVVLTVDNVVFSSLPIGEAAVFDVNGILSSDVSPTTEQNLPSIQRSSTTPQDFKLSSTSRIMSFKGLKGSRYLVQLSDEYPLLMSKKRLTSPEGVMPAGSPSSSALSTSSTVSNASTNTPTPVTIVPLFTDPRQALAMSDALSSQRSSSSPQKDKPHYMRVKSSQRTVAPVGSILRALQDDSKKDSTAENIQRRHNRALTPISSASGPSSRPSVPPLDLTKVINLQSASLAPVPVNAKPVSTVLPQPEDQKRGESSAKKKNAQQPFVAFSGNKIETPKEEAKIPAKKVSRGSSCCSASAE